MLLARLLSPSAAIALVLFAAGCASEGGGGRTMLPAALSSRWSAPDFATRVVDGERVAVVDACVGAANALGYSVNRVDGAVGKVCAARAPAASFEGGRQQTLEINVSVVSPQAVRVSLTLREVVKSDSRDERLGGMVTTSRIRDRAPYDAFFERLRAGLTPPP